MSSSQPPPPSLTHPGRWLWLLLLVPIALGLARLRFDAEVFDLLPANLPAVEGLKLYQRYFANARELVITVQATSAEQAEGTARSIAEYLRAQTNLVANVTWEAPWQEHPEQLAELLAYLWLNQPPGLFGELTNRLAPDKLVEILANTREELATSLSPDQIARLSYDPFGLTRLPENLAGAAPSLQGQDLFSSPDGTFRILFVQARSDLRTYRDCAQWLDALKGITTGARPSSGTAGFEKVRSPPNSAIARQTGVAAPEDGRTPVKLGFTGRPAFVAEIAAGMQHDMTCSVGGTAAIIAVLFWVAHRRIKPMLWLLTLLALVLGSTLAIGGLIFGTINVVSVGFAAVLLGLAVDYAVVHYQEALAEPDLTIPQIRHAIAPSIFWAAVTTITAFLVLNFGGLPGLGQLGTLVGLGVALAACIMIFEFLPPLFPERRQPKQLIVSSAGQNASGPGRTRPASRTGDRGPQRAEPEIPGSRLGAHLVFALTAGVVLLACAVLLFLGRPRIDATANALRPRNSPAYTAAAQIQARLSQRQESLWLIVAGQTEDDVARRLAQVQSVLNTAVSNHLIADFKLPAPLWPQAQYQEANRPIARALAAKRQTLRQAALANGFAESSLALTEKMLDTWQAASANPGVFWPSNPMSQFIFEKVAARTPTNFFAVGLLNLPANNPAAAQSGLTRLERELPHQNVWLSGWELLGSTIFGRVKANMWKVLAPMVFLVLLSLYLAFRRPMEIVLSLAVLLLSGLCLLAVMRLAHWSWNLLDLMAIPLVLGTGVDYSIFMQLALRRYQGDLSMAHQAVGRALLLCGGTAIAGFGSLAWSSNAGMASLGQVCAVGVGSNMLIAIFLLPVWWKALQVQTPRSEVQTNPRTGNHGPVSQLSTFNLQPSTPSFLYRPEFWRVGLKLVKLLPASVCTWLAHVLVSLYWWLARKRREVVIQNLLPALRDDAVAAETTAKALFHQFALKLVALFRYEAGLPLDGLLGATSGWEHFVEAQSHKRGVLLLTPHLGNWEFGGPLLTQRGVRLQVITQAEPGRDFTELRQASRARWNIETLVIRDNPLAFVEIIRRLESGATVALLVDRPPPPTSIAVELFGRPFAASLAAAELARASGCVLLPAYLPRWNGAYEAHFLPSVPYERAALRDRQARQELTQRIMRTFEPLILQHLDQWYHFVPIWPKQPGTD
jgi:predicted RND superfamily exporter protein/lauroyl/myristoyl acyltransferase